MALCATLPPLDGQGREAVARLVAEGPPGEEVGMDAYALDPGLDDHGAVLSDGTEFLGMPDARSGSGPIPYVPPVPATGVRS